MQYEQATMRNSRRVVITGLGAVTPLGATMRSTWEGLLAGRSGIGPLTRFEAPAFPCRIAGEARAFDPLLYLSKKEIRRHDRFIQFAVAAAEEAIADAGLSPAKENPERISVAIGTGRGGIETLERNVVTSVIKGFKGFSPHLIPASLPNLAAGEVALRFGARGSLLCPSSACATGAQALGEGMRLIQRGSADLVLAGGSEAPLCATILGGYAAARALSCRNDDPTRASRPFDRDRDGFVLSEGSSVLILEELTRALDRGARIYAELSGYGCTTDAYHPILPDPSGAGAARAIEAALKESGLAPGEIAYINAHGTGTIPNDRMETAAIRKALGPAAERVAVSATKSMTGHLLGASGALEAAITALALHHGIVPPTINLEHPDPACDLDYVPWQARELEAESALSHAFGFGGINVVLAFRRRQPC